MLFSLPEMKTLLCFFFFVFFFLYYFLDQIIKFLKVKIKLHFFFFSSRKVLYIIDSRDKISALPDEVLCHILSFLTTKSAVKTSILSKRWLNVWASTPALEFKRQEFTQVDSFIRFVNQVLKSRRGSAVQVFILEWKQQFDEGMAEKWLDHAARRNIRMLKLDIQPITKFSLPASLLCCPSLQLCHLKAPRTIKASHMDSGKLIPVVNVSTVQLPCSSNLIQLKALALYAVANPSNLLGKLISSCPMLERLSMSIGKDDLNVSAPNLKRLALSCSRGAKTSKIHIFAPRLQRFHLSFVGLPEISLDVRQCVMNATIWKGRLQDVDAQRFFGIMTSLAHARTLQLEGMIIEVLTKHLSSFSLRFHSLASLHIEALLNEDGIRTISVLLKTCPNLERLVIHNTKAGCVTAGDPWTPTELDIKYTMDNLKEIRIDCFIGDKDELGLIKFFLQNGITLGKVVISCKKESQYFENFKKISQGLLALPRASPSALVYLD